MAEEYKCIEVPDIEVEPPPPEEPIDWTLCALCQVTKTEKLVCPARKPPAAGYKYVAENLKQFQEMGFNPVDVSLCRLDEGDGFKKTFRLKSACWHKSCFSKVSSTILERKRKQADSPTASPIKTRRAAGTSSTAPEDNDGEETQASTKTKPRLCFFCNEPPGPKGLHVAWTLGVHYKVHYTAVHINDTDVLRKLANADMVAGDANYHLKCLAAYYRKQPKANKEDNSSSLHAIAFAELVAFVESYRDDTETRPLFYMSHLSRLYASRLEAHGLHVPERVHSMRLREKLLANVPDLFSTHEGKNIVLMFNKDLGAAIKQACTQDSQAVGLVRAAEVVRREIFKFTAAFNGNFEDGCQEKSVPATLRTLIALILDGSAAIEHSHNFDQSHRQAVLTISQLISFNCRKFSRQESSFQRHNKERETPLPIYLSLKVHAETRKKELVDTLSSMGMGISYKRLMAISSQAGNAVIKRFEQDGIVVPPSMRRGVFTVGVVDNIDHNPSSTTASDSFHGTGISLIQTRGVDDDVIEQPAPLFDPKEPCNGIPQLPEKYTTVLPAAVSSAEQFVPKSTGPHKPEILQEVKNHQEEYGWLETVHKGLSNKSSDDTPTEEIAMESPSQKDQLALSWAAYHSVQRPSAGDPKAIIKLLPLLLQNAHSVALIKHVMDKGKPAMYYLVCLRWRLFT